MMRHTDVGETKPGDIRHNLDEYWSGFAIGDRRYEIRRDDLYSIRKAREFAQALSGQSAMWDKELAALEEAAVAKEQAEAAEAAPQTPEPLSDPTAAPDPTPAAEAPADTEPDEPVGGDEPYEGDDLALDKRVQRFVNMPETRRKGATVKEEL